MYVGCRELQRGLDRLRRYRFLLLMMDEIQPRWLAFLLLLLLLMMMDVIQPRWLAFLLIQPRWISCLAALATVDEATLRLRDSLARLRDACKAVLEPLPWQVVARQKETLLRLAEQSEEPASLATDFTRPRAFAATLPYRNAPRKSYGKAL